MQMLKLPAVERFWILILITIALGLGCATCDPDEENGNGNGTGNGPGNGEEPPPVLTDRSQLVLGTVLDYESAAPIEGAEVLLGDLLSRTDMRGRFAFYTDASLDHRTISVSAEGYVNAARSLRGSDDFRIDIGTVVLFSAEATLAVGSNGGQLDASEQGILIDVPSNAFPTDVVLSTSRIPVGDSLTENHYLPAPLPEPNGGHSSTLFALVIDSGGVQPSRALTVHLSLDYLPEGTGVPVGRFDAESANWVDVGVGIIEEGALRFDTDHLSTFAASLPALPTDDTRPPSMSFLERSVSPFMPGDPRIDPRTGALQVGVPLPELIRRSENLSLSLFYDSRTVLPVLRVPVVAKDGRAGESLTARVISPMTTTSIAVGVEESAMTNAAPGVVVEMEEIDGPEEMATEDGMEDLVETEVAPGTYVSEVQLLRTGEGDLAQSESNSFVNPVASGVLTDLDGREISAPNPLEHRSSGQVAVAIDNRSKSPFGQGWHLTGLTRLVQPWCSQQRVTLVGGLDWPALTFSEMSESIVRPLADVFEEVGVLETDLRGARVAVVQDMVYVALVVRREVWRLSPDGTNPVHVAGGGSQTSPAGEGLGTDLEFALLTSISPAPFGEGLLISTDSFITHLQADGTATRLVGRAEPCEMGDQTDIRVGESALNSTFCGYRGFESTLAADPTSDRFLFAMPMGSTYEVVDGTLRELELTESTAMAWPNAAFDPTGRLYYSHSDSDCIFVHDYDEEDTEVFPRCHALSESDLTDGFAQDAVVGGAEAMTFDNEGNLWFLDTHFHAIRRLTPGGEVATVSARRLNPQRQPPTVSGGLLSDTAPGAIRSIAVFDSTRIFMGGANPDDLVTTAPLYSGTLASMGAGDGSILRALEDGGYIRVLESDVVEYYDERGLLLSRGKPEETTLEYHYDGDWSFEQEVEICGLPHPPPRLSSIRVSGEDLWSFAYDSSGHLNRIVDAAGRELRRSSSGANADTFELPCGAQISTRYDDDGRILEKQAPGPRNANDLWSFEWNGRSLSAFARPGEDRVTAAFAEDDVKVTRDSMDGLGIARGIPARIPVGTVPTRSSGSTRVQIGTSGLVVQNPAGNETEIETDSFGRLLRAVMPDGSSLRLARDEVGRLISLMNESTGEEIMYRYRPVVSTPTGLPYLDERLVERVHDRHGSTVFTYDSHGWMDTRTDPNNGTTRIDPVSDSGPARGLPRSVRDPEGRLYQYTYDSSGNMTRLEVQDPYDPNSQLITEIERDAVGRATKVSKPTGVTIRMEYDPWNELIELTVGDPEEGHTVSIVRASTGAWSQGGSLIPVSPVLQATDGEGRLWTFDWTPGWRLSASEEPTSGRTEEVYDDDNRLTTRIFADGSNEVFSYDDAGRMEERRWLGPAAGAWASFSYGEDGTLTELGGPHGVERREISPGFGWTEIAFRSSTAEPDLEFTIRRNLLYGNINTELVGVGQFGLGRDFDDRVSLVNLRDSQQLMIQVISYDYDLSRRLVGIERTSGANTVYEWDELGRIVRQEEITPFDTTVLTWTWDKATPVTLTVNGNERDYTFDGHGRLIACSDTLETYTYDRSNARMSAGEHDYERDLEGRLLSDGVYQYDYDVLGRRILRVNQEDPSDRTVYVYGPGGHLQSVARGAEGSEVILASYIYDPMGRRISRTTDDGTWFYGYLPESDRLVRLLEPDGTEWQFVHARPEAAWSMAVADDGRQRFTHVDALNRVIGISDENGFLTLLEEGCFGQPLNGTEIDAPPIGFHGIPYDSETALYYMGARYYDPMIGAFLSPDPLGLDAAPPVYDYAAGNPITAQDSSGRAVLEVAAAASLLVGALIFNELRKLVQSDDLNETRRTYETITDVPYDEDAVDEAEKHHSRLNRSVRRGGRTAVKCTVKGAQAVTNPAGDLQDVAEAAKDLAESLMDDDDGGYHDED